MARKRSLRYAVSGLAGLAILALTAACGGGSGDSGNAAEADPNAIFRYTSENAVNSLDPQLVSVNFGSIWYGPSYEYLVKIKLDGTYDPYLATSWKMASDYMSMTFTLRDNVKFHDGASLTSSAVKSVLDRGKSVKGSNVATKLAKLKSVDTPDEKTAVLNFTAPTAESEILQVLGDRGTELISPNALTAPNLNTNPVGTGPYQLTSYNPGNKAVFKRFDGWWGGKPKLAGIEISVVADRAAAYNALQSGQMDMVPMPADQIEIAKKTDGVVVYEYPSPQAYHLLINTDSKFADLRVRLALSHAIDRAALSKVTGTKASPTQQYALVNSPIFDDSIKGQPYDPAKAKQLLAEAGFANGFSFRLSFGARPEQQSQGEALQEMLKKAGFDMTLEALDSPALNQKCISDKQCDALIGPNTTSQDFLSNFASYGVSPHFLNKGTVPEFLAVVRPAMNAVEKQARLEASKKVNKAYSELLPETIPLMSTKNQFATNPKVIKGFEFELNQHPRYETISMTK